MNGKHLVLQKNGLYCVTDETMKHILDYNLTREDVINKYAASAIAIARLALRNAPKLDDKCADYMLKYADDDYRRELEYIFDGMKPGMNVRNCFTDFLVEIDFKNKTVKQDFMQEIENVLKNKSVHILFENDTALYVSFNDNFTPILVCKNNKACDYSDDDIQRNEYRFTILCPISGGKDKSAVPINTYNMIKSQFENTKDFNSGNISLHKFGNMIIVLFDIASSVKPILTVV